MKSMGGKRFGPQDSKAKLGEHKQGNELLAWLIIKKQSIQMAHGANGGSWQPQISQVTQVLLNQGLIFMIWLAYLYVCT